MIKIRLLTDADRQQWYDYVTQHPDASAYHQLSWKCAIEQAYQHTCWYWLAVDSSNTVVGILPTTWVKSPLNRGNLCALPFCDVGGVLANTNDIAQTLIQKAISYCQQHNIPYFDHRISKVTTEGNMDVGNIKVRMIMPLPETSEILFGGFKSKLRSQIRKAEKNGLTASTGVDSTHLNDFYQVFCRNMRDLGSPVHSKKWFEQIINAYGKQAIIANVHYKDQVIAAGIVLFIGNRACIPWASTNSDFNKLAPNMLLYWTLLKFANDFGCISFDFGRSTINEGTYRFKSQWGAKPQPLQWQRYSHSGQLLPSNSSKASKLRKLVEQCWQKLPLGLSAIVGPKIRRYISL
jgi:FemAB-related protein (PEP-CTERM system-associated)